MQISNNDQAICDLLIVGGGINGVGIAVDAAGRGLSVVLCEQADLASGTSSNSSKLIHGGLRYLEQFEFRLVREALHEREVLLKKAPHIIYPLRFVMPVDPQLRPAWIIRIGLYLYDYLSGRKVLAKSQAINLMQDLVGAPLHDTFKKGFAYTDCWVDDARLVVLNAMAAKQKGATILTRTQVIAAEREQSLWRVVLKDTITTKTRVVYARALINAAGPWVDEVLCQQLKLSSKLHLKLVKGSHIIVPRIHNNSSAYILQNSDQRVIFVLPYLDKYSLIGTTDVVYEGDPAKVSISREEINYLCQAVNRYFKTQLDAADVVWTYAGVRPLQAENVNNPAAITRDYTFEVDAGQGEAPLLSIFGGKLTTYRKLAEHALVKLKTYFPMMGPAWTESAILPGGDMLDGNFNAFFTQLLIKYPVLPESLLHRYARSYGTLVNELLANVSSLADLGEDFGADLYACEVKYLVVNEWARSAADILWRRTKLGVGLQPEAFNGLVDKLERFISIIS